MEVPFMHPMSQRAYHSPSSHYDDDDILSSSSCNIPVSNTSGSTITFEPSSGGRNSGAPRQRVREMVKMFEGSKSSAPSTPVHRNESNMFTPPKPYFGGAARGSNNSNNYCSSQVSVKQYATQFQEGGQEQEQIKINEKCRRSTGGGGRGCFGLNPTAANQYQDGDEQQQQVKCSEKCRRFAGPGCQVHAPNIKPSMHQLQDAGDSLIKSSERCQRCNVLCRGEEVHYCLGSKKNCIPGQEQNRSIRNEMECNSGTTKANNGLKMGPYSGFAENRNIEMLRFPTKEISESKTHEPRRSNQPEIYEEIDGIPVSLAYDSKTTILRTQEGVRIVVDIAIDSMSSLSAADVICSRVETEMPHSRILTEFQQKSAMIMAGDENRL